MYICCMENTNTTSTTGQGSSVDNSNANKMQELQERAMAQYYKSKTPNLKAQRAYYEELAGIWKARLDELKYRTEFIHLSVQLENSFKETEAVEKTEEPSESN